MTAMHAPKTHVIPKLDVVTPLLIVTITMLAQTIGVPPTLDANIPQLIVMMETPAQMTLAIHPPVVLIVLLIVVTVMPVPMIIVPSTSDALRLLRTVMTVTLAQMTVATVKMDV
jgi:hypothetical protein